jgi:hypothetical protein
MRKIFAMFVIALFAIAAPAAAQTNVNNTTTTTVGGDTTTVGGTTLTITGDRVNNEAPNAFVNPLQYGVSAPPSQFLNTLTGENIWDIREMALFKRTFSRYEFLNMLGFDPCADSTRSLKGARSKGRPFTGKMLKPEEQKLSDSVLVVFSMPQEGTAIMLGAVDSIGKTDKVDSNENFAQMGIHALNMGADVLYVKANGAYQRLVAKQLGVMIGGSGTSVSPTAAGMGGGGVGFSRSSLGIESYPVATGYGLRSIHGVPLITSAEVEARNREAESALKAADEERREMLEKNGGRKAKAASTLKK